MSQGDWGEEKKRAAPCGRAESLISGFISVHLQKNNESQRTRKPGEPRDSEDGEEPLEAESHEHQRSDPKEQEIIICYTIYNVLSYDSNDVSCGTDTEDEPFPSQKKEILQALRDSKQRARKVKDFIDFIMITKIRSPQE